MTGCLARKQEARLHKHYEAANWTLLRWDLASAANRTSCGRRGSHLLSSCREERSTHPPVHNLQHSPPSSHHMADIPPTHSSSVQLCSLGINPETGFEALCQCATEQNRVPISVALYTYSSHNFRVHFESDHPQTVSIIRAGLSLCGCNIKDGRVEQVYTWTLPLDCSLW